MTFEGVVLAFRRAGVPSSRASVALRGMPHGAEIEIDNLDTGAKAAITGELEIELPEHRSSTVILYRITETRQIT